MDLEDWLSVCYLLGIPVDWAYWVAVGINPDGSFSDIGANWFGAFLGLPISFVWPLHVLVEAWFWVLS